MAKSILYQLFGLGGFPEQLAITLKDEGMVLSDEGIKGSITSIGFRAPGRRSAWRRQWFTGSIALTKTRLVALQYANLAINVPLTDERLDRLRITAENDETLLISFDPSLFHPDWSGTLEYRFRTPRAKAFQEQLRPVSDKP
jgi:hypothetical protein